MLDHISISYCSRSLLRIDHCRDVTVQRSLLAEPRLHCLANNSWAVYLIDEDIDDSNHQRWTGTGRISVKKKILQNLIFLNTIVLFYY